MLIRAWIVSIGAVISCAACAAEPSRLAIPEFGHLQSKAVESVDLSVGPFLLWFARTVAPERTEDGTEIKKILQGIESVRIKSYQFEAEGAYSAADIETVRRQLKQAQWKPLVEVRGKNSENVDIFVAIENEVATGFALVASEPTEFTIINVVGRIDPQYIGQVQASLGLPGAPVPTASLSD